MTASTVRWERGMEPMGESVLAIGVFDGVHRGHREILSRAGVDARSRSVPFVAVTFDRDPDQVVSPATAMPQLLTLADKVALLSDAGVDAVLVVPFDRGVADMTPGEFVEDVLLTALTPVSVHVGSDFLFGRRASGDVDVLAALGRSHGFEVHPHDLLRVGGTAVSSSRIRQLVSAGDVEGAAALLGRDTRVAGAVHAGRGEGTSLGFATANLVPVAFAALPSDGVYAGTAMLDDGTTWPAAISVGLPPMFEQATDVLEAHLIGYEGDLVGRDVTLEFSKRLRDQVRYDSVDRLTAAIAMDVADTLLVVGATARSNGAESAG